MFVDSRENWADSPWCVPMCQVGNLVKLGEAGQTALRHTLESLVLRAEGLSPAMVMLRARVILCTIMSTGQLLRLWEEHTDQKHQVRQR